MIRINEQTKIITDAMSVWGWHILAWVFLIKGIGLLFVLNNNIKIMYAFTIGLFCMFLICEYVSLNRRWTLNNSVDIQLNNMEDKNAKEKS